MTPTLHKSIIKTQLNTTLTMEQTKSSHHHQILSYSSDSSCPQNLQKMHKFSLSCIPLNAQNYPLSMTIIT